MTEPVETILNHLVECVSAHPAVRAIGWSGGNRPLPAPGEGDIDLFVLCRQIPSLPERRAMLSSLADRLDEAQVGSLPGGHWGEGDRLVVAGVETWLLYLTLDSTQTELEAILDGRFLGRQDAYYYPVGRLAMWQAMRVLYDADGVLASIRQRLVTYPPELREKMLSTHLAALSDTEDLERAVQRQDGLFYHFALDLAIDHFLLAVFALNRVYFPSRKRSEQFLRGFAIKPERCEQRLRGVIEAGGRPETLQRSFRLWQALAQELVVLAGQP